MAVRGQTTLDFAIGISVFILAVAFSLAFVPGMIQPFTGTDEHSLAADRAADGLSTSLLTAPADPYTLDPSCTAEFFDADGDVGNCRFPADASSLHDALGLSDVVGLNVTIERGGHVASVDGTRLAAGDDVPARATQTVAERVVSIRDESYVLYVRVW